MAKKSSLKVQYNAPVSLSLAIAMSLVLILDATAFKGSLVPAAFMCHGSAASAVPFNFSSPVEYVRLITHVLGNTSWESLLVSSVFILLLGPQMEERYGSPMLSLMMAISTLVAGVLNACLIPQSLTGQSAIVFMLILLSSLAALEKKEIQISWILVLVLFLSQQMHFAALHFDAGTKLSDIRFISFMQRNVGTFTSLAAGIAGSMFGLLIAPKKRSARASSKKDSATIQETEPRPGAQGTVPRPMATPYDRPNPYDGTTAAAKERKTRGSSKEEEIGTLKL